MITSGEDGFLVPQRDEQILLEYVAVLGRDPERRKRIGEAARRTAIQRFDVKMTAEILRKAIRESLDAQAA